jgi:hypothetical protein
MREPTEPFNILREINPIPDEGRALARSEKAQATLAGILSQAHDRHQRRSFVSRRNIFAAALAAATVSGIVLAAWTAQSVHSISVRCYAAADLRSSSVILHEQEQSPILTCQGLSQYNHGSGGTQPGLQACRLPSGAVAVFPAEKGDLCRRLGLKRLRK